MTTPWFDLDFATEEGAVLGLGSEENLEAMAFDKGLSERATYVLVKKETDEEGTATYRYIGEPPTRFKEVEFKA